MRFVFVAVLLAIGLSTPQQAGANIPARPNGALTPQSFPVPPPALSPRDVATLRDAIAKAKDSRFAEAANAARGASDQLVREIVYWLWYKDRGARPVFSEVIDFAKDHPGWPAQRALHNTAERAAINEGRGPNTKVWFDKHAPKTWDGRELYALSQSDAGEREKATETIRRAWIEGDFSEAEEQTFLGRHGHILSAGIHAQRLNWQLWTRKTKAAKRLLPRIGGEARRVADARLDLIAGSDVKFQSLPADVTARWPGLRQDAVRHYRRAGQFARAKALITLPNSRSPAGFDGRWWRELHILARELLEIGDARGAYDVARVHTSKSGDNFADAEWFLGWVALRRLNDPALAFEHFSNLHRNVSAPISLGRAGYWAGRAVEARNQTDAAMFWYKKAAEHRQTYYGQLAAGKIGRTEDPFFPFTEPGLVDWNEFNARQMVRAVRMLAQVGAPDLTDDFLFALARSLTAKHDHLMLGVLAHQVSRSGRLVLLGRAAARSGLVIPEIAYPLYPFPQHERLIRRPELALVHALSRQESAMDPTAVSSAGARGLMQLMPATAKIVAKQMKVPFDRKKLILDPDYNAVLGMWHLQDLIERYRGSYVLALAAYNAGPSRANQWIGRFGDPRNPAVDPVDWVELIPFGETRNYVQRILENLQVYRTRIAGGPILFRTLGDLSRGATQR